MIGMGRICHAWGFSASRRSSVQLDPMSPECGQAFELNGGPGSPSNRHLFFFLIPKDRLWAWCLTPHFPFPRRKGIGEVVAVTFQTEIWCSGNCLPIIHRQI
eukprot:EG_transcript_54379